MLRAHPISSQQKNKIGAACLNQAEKGQVSFLVDGAKATPRVNMPHRDGAPALVTLRRNQGISRICVTLDGGELKSSVQEAKDFSDHREDL